MQQRNYMEEIAYNARCGAAVNVLKVFIADAKNQLKSSIELSTLELILSNVDGDSEGR